MLTRARPLLGTFVEIRVSGPDRRAAHGAIDAAFRAIATIHRLMSFHASGSDVSRLNREAAQRPVSVHPHTARVLRCALELSRASGGLFDCTIGARLVADGRLPGPLPPRLSPHADYRDVRFLDASRVRFLRPLLLDLGGIAKGYAVDCAVEILARRGMDWACVNAGGDLRVIGPRDFEVELRLPHSATHTVPALRLQDGALATTAGYFGGAILAPRGVVSAPISGSISVLAPRCMHADALTKIVWLSGNTAHPLLPRYGARALSFDPQPEPFRAAA